MPQLRVRPKAACGLITEVTPESAGWTYVGFPLHRLEPEDTIAAETGAREVCLVLISGKAALQIDGRILASSANA
jgi:5-deoxy-glucuronate isomerase